MNSSKKITLALTALALSTGASARPLMETLYGIGRWDDGASEGVETLGYADLAASEFPAFGNFAWGQGDRQQSAAFGMAYRTQRHILARKRKEVGAKTKLASTLSVSQPLGSLRSSADAGRLISVVKVDQAYVPAYLTQYSAWSDQASMLLGRLERAHDRELTVAIRSKDGARIRPIYVYTAEKTGDFWVCKFWDSNVQSSADGVADAGRGRFHRLRFRADGQGDPQVSWSWVAAVKDDQDFWQGEVEDAGDYWGNLTWDQVYSVNYGGGDWDYEADLLSVADRDRDLRLGVENAGGLHTHIDNHRITFGTFDEAILNPGAPASETD